MRRALSGDVSAQTHLFGVLEVLEQRLLAPGYTLVDVCGGVRETLDLTGLAAEEAGDASAYRVIHVEYGDVPVKVGADFVRLASTHGMALRAACLEETGTLASVTYT